MNKTLESRIRRLEKLVKNESVETNRVAKDAMDNIMAELDTLDAVADEFGDKFVKQLYKVRSDLSLLDKMIKVSMSRDIETSDEIWWYNEKINIRRTY